MAQIRQDRRSQRTQQALMHALLALLAEKLYDEISINDIVERAKRYESANGYATPGRSAMVGLQWQPP